MPPSEPLTLIGSYSAESTENWEEFRCKKGRITHIEVVIKVAMNKALYFGEMGKKLGGLHL